MAQKTGYRPTPANPTTTETHAPSERPASDDSDVFLDEIDAVLEENELEVLRAFVQRGGQ
jgi:ubiquitin-like protein Pup